MNVVSHPAIEIFDAFNVYRKSPENGDDLIHLLSILVKYDYYHECLDGLTELVQLNHDLSQALYEFLFSSDEELIFNRNITPSESSEKNANLTVVVNKAIVELHKYHSQEKEYYQNAAESRLAGTTNKKISSFFKYDFLTGQQEFCHAMTFFTKELDTYGESRQRSTPIRKVVRNFKLAALFIKLMKMLVEASVLRKSQQITVLFKLAGIFQYLPDLSVLAPDFDFLSLSGDDLAPSDLYIDSLFFEESRRLVDKGIISLEFSVEEYFAARDHFRIDTDSIRELKWYVASLASEKLSSNDKLMLFVILKVKAIFFKMMAASEVVLENSNIAIAGFVFGQLNLETFLIDYRLFTISSDLDLYQEIEAFLQALPLAVDGALQSGSKADLFLLRSLLYITNNDQNMNQGERNYFAGGILRDSSWALSLFVDDSLYGDFLDVISPHCFDTQYDHYQADEEHFSIWAFRRSRLFEDMCVLLIDSRKLQLAYVVFTIGFITHSVFYAYVFADSVRIFLKIMERLASLMPEKSEALYQQLKWMQKLISEASNSQDEGNKAAEIKIVLQDYENYLFPSKTASVISINFRKLPVPVPVGLYEKLDGVAQGYHDQVVARYNTFIGDQAARPINPIDLQSYFHPIGLLIEHVAKNALQKIVPIDRRDSFGSIMIKMIREDRVKTSEPFMCLLQESGKSKGYFEVDVPGMRNESAHPTVKTLGASLKYLSVDGYTDFLTRSFIPLLECFVKLQSSK